MRRRLRLMMVCMGLGMAAAFSQSGSSVRSPIAYWEAQPVTLVRDTTLIHLYVREAHALAHLDSSLIWLQKGVTIAMRTHSKPWLAHIHNQIGLKYLQKGISFKAIEYLYRGLQYAELCQDADKQAFSWKYIGECYASLANYEKAIQAGKEAIRFYETAGDLPGLAQALNSLAAAYRESSQPDESIAVLERSLITAEALQNPTLLASAYFHLSATYLKKGAYAAAETYGIKAVNIEVQSRGRANAELLSLLSLIKSYSFDTLQALNYADRAGLFLNYEWPSRRERTAYNLYQVYKNLDIPDKALSWHEMYLSQRELNASEAQKKRMEILRYEHEARQRDERLQLMTRTMEQQGLLRNILLFCLLIFSGLAISLYRSNRLLHRKRKELDETNARLLTVGQLLQKTNATLEDRVEERTRELLELNHALTLKNHEIQEALFRGQSMERKRVASELHNNLGSLLSGVKWRLESIDFESFPPAEQSMYHSVVKLITDAYNQVRHISHNLLPSILEKEGLIPALKKLVDDLNRSGKTSFELICTPDMILDDQKISFELYSCALELINNILKHANARQVVIELVRTDTFYILMVTDDGRGIVREKMLRGTGLENIHQRVKSLQGTFSIYALKNNQGTLVTLKIPHGKMLVA